MRRRIGLKGMIYVRVVCMCVCWGGEAGGPCNKLAKGKHIHVGRGVIENGPDGWRREEVNMGREALFCASYLYAANAPKRRHT